MITFIVSQFKYLAKIFGLSNGGSLIVNSLVAFVATSVLNDHISLLIRDTDKRNILIPIAIEVFVLIVFCIITIVDQISGVAVAKKEKTYSNFKLWSTITVKLFAFSFISTLFMCLSILCEILDADTFYNLTIGLQLLLFLMAVSYELSSFNRNTKKLTGKGYKPIESIISIFSFVIRKTALSKLSFLNPNITEEEKKELDDKMKESLEADDDDVNINNK